MYKIFIAVYCLTTFSVSSTHQLPDTTGQLIEQMKKSGTLYRGAGVAWEKRLRELGDYEGTVYLETDDELRRGFWAYVTSISQMNTDAKKARFFVVVDLWGRISISSRIEEMTIMRARDKEHEHKLQKMVGKQTLPDETDTYSTCSVKLIREYDTTRHELREYKTKRCDTTIDNTLFIRAVTSKN